MSHWNKEMRKISISYIPWFVNTQFIGNFLIQRRRELFQANTNDEYTRAANLIRYTHFNGGDS